MIDPVGQMMRRVVLEKGEASCGSQSGQAWRCRFPAGGNISLKQRGEWNWGAGEGNRVGRRQGAGGRLEAGYWGESGEQNGEMVDRGWSWVLFSQHKQQPQAQIAQHKRRFNDSFEYLGH